MIYFAATQFGFEWGSAKITRCCSDKKKGWVILGLETPKHKGNHFMQIYVSKSGKVRIWSKGGEWKPPTKAKP